MPKYSKRSQKMFKKRLAQENPVGKVHWVNTGFAGSLPGQQEMITLPLSLTQAEIMNMYQNYGPNGTNVSSRTEIIHDERSDAQVANAQAMDINGLTSVMKEFIYCYDTSRKYMIKNHGNQNMEIICYKVQCVLTINTEEYDCLTSNNTHEAISLLCKQSAANSGDVVQDPMERHGINTSTTTSASVADATLAVNADNDIKGAEGNALEFGATDTFGGVGINFKNWARIGFTPAEVKIFNKHFKIVKRNRKILATNEVMELKWFSDAIRKVNTRQLGGTGFKDVLRKNHTVQGTSWLVLIIRGLPAVMQLSNEDNLYDISRAGWHYADSGSGIFRTASDKTSACDVVTIAPSSIIWTLQSSSKFGSLQNSYSKIYNIDSVYPTALTAANPVVEIDEDGETAHKYRTSFRIA